MGALPPPASAPSVDVYRRPTRSLPLFDDELVDRIAELRRGGRSGRDEVLRSVPVHVSQSTQDRHVLAQRVERLDHIVAGVIRAGGGRIEEGRMKALTIGHQEQTLDPAAVL